MVQVDPRDTLQRGHIYASASATMSFSTATLWTAAPPEDSALTENSRRTLIRSEKDLEKKTKNPHKTGEDPGP